MSPLAALAALGARGYSSQHRELANNINNLRSLSALVTAAAAFAASLVVALFAQRSRLFSQLWKGSERGEAWILSSPVWKLKLSDPHASHQWEIDPRKMISWSQSHLSEALFFCSVQIISQIHISDGLATVKRLPFRLCFGCVICKCPQDRRWDFRQKPTWWTNYDFISLCRIRVLLAQSMWEWRTLYQEFPRKCSMRVSYFPILIAFKNELVNSAVLSKYLQFREQEQAIRRCFTICFIWLDAV